MFNSTGKCSTLARKSISHSSNERVMLPDVSICLHFMLRNERYSKQFEVYPKNMLKNLNIYGGVIFSRKFYFCCREGLSREKAYSLVQKNAHQAWNTQNGNFKQNIER